MRAKEKPPAHVQAVFLFSLLLDVREKPHEASTLHCRFHRALLLGREARLAAIHHAAVRIDEILQEINVFVINVLDVVLRQNVIGCHII